MKRHDSILVVACVGLLVYALLLSFLGPVVSSLLTNKTVANQGTITAIGVGVYWNSNGTNAVTSFNWGMIDPGGNKSITCYIKNEGTRMVTLTMYTSNWSPTNATQYMTFSWNLEGQTLNPGQIKQAIFTLQVSASIQGITNFSFDVTIVGSG
ncbi:MAG: hypothetical protein QXX08_06725 [Candidatus Bathyarchaeia archaeon]